MFVVLLKACRDWISGMEEGARKDEEGRESARRPPLRNVPILLYSVSSETRLAVC